MQNKFYPVELNCSSHLYSSSLSQDLHHTPCCSLIDWGPLSDTITHSHVSAEAIVLLPLSLLCRGPSTSCRREVATNNLSRMKVFKATALDLPSLWHRRSSAFQCLTKSSIVILRFHANSQISQRHTGDQTRASVIIGSGALRVIYVTLAGHWKGK